MRIGVYIAGRRCPELAKKCVESLRAQSFQGWVACVTVDGQDDKRTFDACVEAAKGDERIMVNWMDRVHSCHTKLAAITALVHGFGQLADADILVGLDLDDSLTPNALQRIHDTHEAGAWVTYGNWEDQGGNVNPHAPMTTELFGRVRHAQWFLTAPNTFRVGLFERVPQDFFRWNDDRGYYETGFDGSVMYGVADLAGPDRITSIASPIYIYNKDRADSVVKAWPLEHRVKLFNEQRNKRRLERLDSFSRPDGSASVKIEKGDSSGS